MTLERTAGSSGLALRWVEMKAAREPARESFRTRGISAMDFGNHWRGIGKSGMSMANRGPTEPWPE